ncbi:SCF ubiquitin ligase complex subunit cdc4 [Coelomomyces lativittatus]|nr:SCF ubiquitin ligase complex subunit cdc4 [Coelomomyces lativittatus]
MIKPSVCNTLVSGSTDRTVRVWDLSTGKTTHIFKGHTSTVRCLQILLPVTHPIEKKGYIASSTCLTYSVTPMLTEPLIVTGSRDATLRVWRLPDPTQHSNEESPQLVDDSLGQRGMPLSHLSLSPSTSTSTSPYSFYPPTLSNANTTTPSSSSSLHTSFSTLQQLPSLLLHYDRLPEQLQHYILFQLLRRSSVSCLHLISSLVQPALKRDFIALLPYEIAMNILYRLDAKTLCRGARVSSRWRTLIDGNARLWKFQGYQEGLWGSEGTSTTLKLRNPHLVLALQQQAQQCHVEIDWSLFTSPDAFQDLVSRAYSPSLPFPSLTTSTAIASTPTSATTSIFTTTPTPATTTTTTTNHHHHHHHHHNNVHSSNSGGSNVLPLQVGGTMMIGAGILGEEKKEKSGLPLYVPGNYKEIG